MRVVTRMIASHFWGADDGLWPVSEARRQCDAARIRS